MRLGGSWLAQTWQSRGLAAHMLLPVSLLYAGITRLHRLLYRWRLFKTERCRVPIIVVGNVVAGGGGKTPLVIALGKYLQSKGLRIGVISRGYGRPASDCLEVLAATPVAKSGDEPALIFIALAAPVYVASRRIDAARALLSKYPDTDVIICDDGLQHHSLARDIEVLVFDDRGVGNGWLLPAGPLREKYAAGQPATRQAPSVVLHTGQVPAFAGFASARRLADSAVAADGRQIPLAALKGKPIIALAGIANPGAFFDMLRARGLQLKRSISLPDHADFSHFNLPTTGHETLLCTEKDAVKLFKLYPNAGLKLLAVPLVFAPEPAFFTAIDTLLEPLLRART